MTPLEDKLMKEIQNEPWYQNKYRKEIVRILARVYFRGKEDCMQEVEWERKNLKRQKSLAEMFLKMLDESPK